MAGFFAPCGTWDAPAQAPNWSSFELLAVFCLGVRFCFPIVIHHKGSIRFHILVMARRFAFSDQDVLLHAFRFSSFSIDIPGGRLAPERLRRSGIARPIVDKKREKEKGKKNVEVVDLVKRFPTRIWSRRSASIQRRTDRSKFEIEKMTKLDEHSSSR